MKKPDPVVATFDVMSIADLCIDIIVTGPSHPRFGQVELFVDDYAMELGGSVGIFSTQFSKLGGRIALIGAVGDDHEGRFILDRLSAAGVDTSLITVIKGIKTAMGLNISVNGDRALLTYPGTLDLVAADMLRDECIGRSKHWHVGSFFLLHRLEATWPGWIKKLKRHEITVSLDTNWSPSENWGAMIETLQLVDIFLPNEAEALAITRENTVIAAGMRLAELCPLVVVKCAERGAMVFTSGSSTLFPVNENLTKNLVIRDTTGAGDNFDAGFIYHWLKGHEIETCVEAGTACAVSSIRSLGGLTGQLNRYEHAKSNDNE